jgi:hypothetical protein
LTYWVFNFTKLGKQKNPNEVLPDNLLPVLLFVLTALKSPLLTLTKPATETTGGFIVIVSRNMVTCKENQLVFTLKRLSRCSGEKKHEPDN